VNGSLINLDPTVTPVSPLPIAPLPVVPLIGASADELSQWVQTQGQPAYRGKQLHQWIYERGIQSLSEVTVFPKAWRDSVADVNIGRSRIAFRAPSNDGTVKYLLEMSDGQIIEAVGIPAYKNGRNQLDRLTVCVSSQVGCPMKCDFCATGKGGFTRNLDRHEIVDQILTVQSDFGHRVSNVVFMGMGEPLLNVDTVIDSVRSMNQDIGIGQRYITISTVGIPGQIDRLADRQLQATLAVSLHASNQQVREQLIPSARQYPLSALLEECRNYVNTTGRRVTFEYIVLAGVNDHTEHAHELAQLLKGFQSHVNLIPYNPISEVDYQRPSDRQLQVFMTTLKAKNVAVSVRRSRGLDANAACGQLRANQLQHT
jgi:23S rRNA (adenine2503-C2)-methyltransferase